MAAAMAYQPFLPTETRVVRLAMRPKPGTPHDGPDWLRDLGAEAQALALRKHDQAALMPCEATMALACGPESLGRPCCPKLARFRVRMGLHLSHVKRHARFG